MSSQKITLNNIEDYSSRIIKNKLSSAEMAARLPVGAPNAKTLISTLFCGLNPELCNNHSAKEISPGAIIDIIYRLGANEFIYMHDAKMEPYIFYRNRTDKDDVFIFGSEGATGNMSFGRFGPEHASAAKFSIAVYPAMQVQPQQQSVCDKRARNFSDTLLALETNMQKPPTKALIEKVKEQLLLLRQQLEECRGVSDTWRISRVNEFKVTADRYKAWKETGVCDVAHAMMQMDIISKILTETYTSTKKARIERLLAEVRECRQLDITRIVSLFNAWSAAGQAHQQETRRAKDEKEARQRQAGEKQADQEREKDRRLKMSLANVFTTRAEIIGFLADMKTAEDSERYDEFLHKYAPIAESFIGRNNPDFMARYNAILKKRRQSAEQQGGLGTAQRANLLRVLGLDSRSTAVDVKKAYRKLSLTEHPDKGGDADRFRRITQAYKKLIS
jgi:ribosomal protein L12E/L44/L45/RPP1/RPP2